MKITCLCLTHGRPYLVNEALESFLRQDPVPGVETEMLIVNDCAEQTLVYKHPRVRIVNLDRQITNMSQKLNQAVCYYVASSHVAMWEDDDISLPYRIRQSVRTVETNLHRPFRLIRAWYAENNVIRSRPCNLFFGSAMFERVDFMDAGGADLNGWMDKSAWENMTKRIGTVGVDPTPQQTYFIYRWGGPGVHDSAPKGLLSRATNEERARVFHDNTVSSPLFVPGEIELEPYWQHDYTRMAETAIQDGKGELL